MLKFEKDKEHGVIIYTAPHGKDGRFRQWFTVSKSGYGNNWQLKHQGQRGEGERGSHYHTTVITGFFNMASAKAYAEALSVEPNDRAAEAAYEKIYDTCGRLK